MITLTLLLNLLPASTFAAPKPAVAPGFYDLKVNPLAGETIALSKYRGKALMIVNTASHCGYTPQYAGLQSLYQKYHDQGFEILAFPSNDFGKQEPGSGKEIKEFCDTKYKVTFPLFEKNPVSGDLKQPLYQWLIANDPSVETKNSEVKWNFEKFVISRDGKVIARFRSKVTPESDEVKAAVEAALKK